jgi:hypothetical protein
MAWKLDHSVFGLEDDIEIATDGLPRHDSMAGLIAGRVNYKVRDPQRLVALWHYSVMYTPTP